MHSLTFAFDDLSCTTNRVTPINGCPENLGAIVGSMLTSIRVVIALSLCVPLGSNAQSQAPAPATLTLSLKTMGKALSRCRASYQQGQDGTTVPLLQTIIGDSDFGKDMTSLTHAETLVNGMAAHPERVTGKVLVAALSSVDDYMTGVGSTRLAILVKVISDAANNDHTTWERLNSASASLADCQANLFNAGDDFVGLVLDYVGAEDDVVAARNRRRK